MSPSWYLNEKLARAHSVDMLRSAENERRASEAREGQISSPRLPRLFSWMGQQASALRQQSESWFAKYRSLASQKHSYLDNPDPFKNCSTC
jgi:hypothetical protein